MPAETVGQVVTEGGHSTTITVRVESTHEERALTEWDRLVVAAPGTDVTQLSAWARVRHMAGFDAVYLFARRGPCLVGGTLVLLRHVRGLGSIGYAAHGPVIAVGGEERVEVARALAVGLTRLTGVRMLFVQPPEGADDLSALLVAHGFRPSERSIFWTGSMRIDLDRSEDELRRALSPRLRSWTRRWPDAGVSVRMGDADDVPVLARLMHATANARGHEGPPPLSYLQRMYTELASTGNAALFVGEVHGRPVTADLVTMCGTTVRGRLSGFDRSGEWRRLSVPGAARWEMIRWAKRSGYRWLDFGGLSEQTLRDALDNGIRWSDDWPSTDRAKMHYGGVVFRHPMAVELIRPRVVRATFDAATGTPWGRAVLQHAQRHLRRHRPRCQSEVGTRGEEAQP
jgi:lipid II:glycine glycyltransferase (peptidoglycan interpeptide bridge formation enzyme)